jgi:hypothetical protein
MTTPSVPTPSLPTPFFPTIGQPYELRFAADDQGTPCPVFWVLNPDTAPRPPTQIVRRLLGGIALRDVPVFTPTCFLGDPNGPGEFRRVTYRQEHLAPEGTAEDMHGVAWRNLCRRPAAWTELETGVLLCSDFLAAERVVDPMFMRSAASRLAGNHAAPLVAALPCRGHLIVSRMNTDGMRTLAPTAQMLFASAGAAALSPWLYMVVDGHVTTAFESVQAAPAVR